VASGGTRIIEYEVVPWAGLSGMGDLPTLVTDAMGAVSHVGILRCITDGGRKVTFVGQADATVELVRSGAASNPNGVNLSKKSFPVMLEGWPYRFRAE
jgi:hypothetical protein